jgi:medium-chain acyl-[acyl-carrier-protein] hydrolase
MPRPPHLVRLNAVHELRDAEFVAYLRALGGLPAQFLASEDLMSTMLPVLRADCSVVASCAAQPRVKLPVPIHVLSGTRDPSVTLPEAAA